MIGFSQIQSSESAATWISFLMDAITTFTDADGGRGETFTNHFTGCQSISNSIPFLMYPLHFHAMSLVSYPASLVVGRFRSIGRRIVSLLCDSANISAGFRSSFSNNEVHKSLKGIATEWEDEMEKSWSDVKKPFKRPINCPLTINNRPSRQKNK